MRHMSEYLTTRELAELLRIKERKVYDLAASGDVPVSRATGKLLFPRKAVEAWLASSQSGAPAVASQEAAARPNVFLGSHDPLLDWALRESRCGVATFFDGSLDGLSRFVAGQGIAAGMHVHDTQNDSWNVPVVAEKCGQMAVVLVEWAQRQRGLVVAEGVAEKIGGVSDLKGMRVATRQPEAGAQQLFLEALTSAGLGVDDLGETLEVRTEVEAVMAVLEGKVDAAFGLEALAGQLRLAFVPLLTERFDLLVDRRAWFERPMQSLLTFCGTERFAARAKEFAGYDVSGFGRVHFNGA